MQDKEESKNGKNLPSSLITTHFSTLNCEWHNSRISNNGKESLTTTSTTAHIPSVSPAKLSS